MIRNCKIKQCIIGAGRPKICVPIVGHTVEDVLCQADRIVQVHESSTIDMVELRGDYLEFLSDLEQLKQLLEMVRPRLEKQVLLFTIRSEKEGGQKLAFSQPSIADINRFVIENKLADLVDLELMSGEDSVRELVRIAHENDVKIIMSNHDFITTPSESEIIQRLTRMQELGADIAKLAAMPNDRLQVLQLLRATVTMQKEFAQVPIVTMSMGSLGAISRISGQLFGSAVTFASLEVASAPGQIPVSDLSQLLAKVEQYCI
ncbi:MAG: type I 3-dehydroquinate dehydratase [Wujia sp.]